MKPSVGRIVHYMARGSLDGRYPPVCRAAIIAGLNRTTAQLVDIAVINPTGMFFHENCLFDETNEPGTWHWPERVD